ncbi:hypothetical protein [Mesorhizobium neociceri]|uniref:DUF1837 domain-containing protein n=1 Tax=Mesorhizobium neociceri TaxID=1307853 RepID=A0A838B4W0_9HYPH|nr:hypothetical protein [Mesorhizobium neociceri]MBA1141127.1 hypothetical protein [Mesorhizobium neociceri]
MLLEFTDITSDPAWAGSSWKVVSGDELAKLVARVALGQSRYALHVLEQIGFVSPKAAASTLTGAIKLLTAPDPKKPYQRDGWIFQVLSWIAAHLQDRSALIREPHMYHAHKGFDGIHVKVDADTKRVMFVVVCEEKATENPRKTVREKVWPEFEGLEKAERDHQLLSEVIAVLRTDPEVDVDQAIEEIVWKDARSYRVAVTVGDTDDPADTFDGYPGVVAGEIVRRRAEVLPLKELRAWMADIANKAIAHAKELTAPNV